MSFSSDLLAKISEIITFELSTKERTTAEIVFNKAIEFGLIPADTKQHRFCPELGLHIRNGNFPNVITKQGRNGGIQYTKSIEENKESPPDEKKSELKIETPESSKQIESVIVEQFSEPEIIKDGYAAVNEVALAEIEKLEENSSSNKFEEEKFLAKEYFSSKNNRISGKFKLPQTNVLFINNLPWNYHVSPWFVYNFIVNVLECKESTEGNVKLDNFQFECSGNSLVLLLKFLAYQVEGYVQEHIADLYVKQQSQKYFVAAPDRILIDEYKNQCFNLINIEKGFITESMFEDNHIIPRHLVQLVSFLGEKDGN